MDINEEADLKDVLVNLPGYIYWKNTLSEYIGCNKNLARISNLKSCDEIVGKKDEDFGWGEEQAEAFRADDRLVMETGETRITEHTLPIFQNGQLTYIHVRTEKMPLHNQRGRVIGILGVALDVTELKKVQQNLKEEKEMAEAANRAKTEFLENMRHDIRTPLTGIVGSAELLHDELDKDKRKEYTNNLVEASKELLRFLNEILESINVATGELPLLKKKFSLKENLESVVKLHQPKALTKQLKLNLYVDEDLPVYLIGDPVRIYRVVLELLVNALKFTNQGHINIHAHLAKKEGNNVIIKVIIEDTGPGVLPEKQQELFVRFKRLTPSYQGIYKGAGLGLSIVKQFVDDLQGEIYVESQMDKGTKFTCIFPLKEALLAEPLGIESISSHNLFSIMPVTVSKPSQNEEMLKSESPIHVLVVEDQEIAAAVAKTTLEKLGCKVDIATDGWMAIQSVKKDFYPLIFMDIGLPNIDGYEATDQIRYHEKETGHRTLIIGLTAHVDPEKEEQALKVGMDMILSKPLTQDTAAKILENLHSGSKQDLCVTP